MSVPKLPPLTVARLAVRDGRACLHCGTDETLTVQHRAVKGHGGRRSAERLSNGIILCNALNVAVEQSAEVAWWAAYYGWKILTSSDPSAVSVYDAGTGRWWLLDDRGGRIETGGPTS